MSLKKGMFRNRLGLLLLLLALTASKSMAVETSGKQWVVVSMRQYLLEGSSRIHLYLYSFDGKFQKALTDDSGFNDLDPVFSNDGGSILFTREAVDKAHANAAGSYVVDLETGKVRPFNSSKEYFNRGVGSVDWFASAFRSDEEGWLNTNAASYHSPDGRFCIELKSNSSDSAHPSLDDGWTFSLATKDKPSTPIAGLPGFLPADVVDGFESFYIANGSPYIMGGEMAVVFLRHYLGSTDGESIWALDLNTMTGAQVSPNGASVYHPASAPGVFVIAHFRYLPLGDTGKTVNCSNLEWWDAHLKMVKYGPELSVCSSAAIYGGSPLKAVVIGGRQ